MTFETLYLSNGHKLKYFLIGERLEHYIARIEKEKGVKVISYSEWIKMTG